jgi:hypothetical protein
MKTSLVLVFCLVPILAAAEIYKSVDNEGNVLFSDKPTPGAKKIPEQLTPTYSPSPPALPKIDTAAPSSVTAVIDYYTALRILKPAPGETVREPSGALTIELKVTPPLKNQQGHMLVIAVDGNNLSSHDNATQIALSNLSNGTHTRKAQIMDATGQVQFSSDSITFVMQRRPHRGETQVPAGMPTGR